MCCQSNNWWRFRRILWPSQNIWTLPSPRISRPSYGPRLRRRCKCVCVKPTRIGDTCCLWNELKIVKQKLQSWYPISCHPLLPLAPAYYSPCLAVSSGWVLEPKVLDMATQSVFKECSTICSSDTTVLHTVSMRCHFPDATVINECGISSIKKVIYQM